MNEKLIVAKILKSYEFDTEEEMKKYFEEHPEANKHNHWVKKKEQKEQKQESKPEKKQVKENKGQKEFDFDIPEEHRPKLDKHKKSSFHFSKKVDNITKTHEIEEDGDELKEMAGFKKTLGKQVPEKDFGKYYVRSPKQLQKDFLANMNPSNYKSPEDFKRAQEKIKNMPVVDFAKVLAAIVVDEEEEL